jgi:hypothetical protein
VANALILPGEKERETDLRGEPLPGMEEEPMNEAKIIFSRDWSFWSVVVTFPFWFNMGKAAPAPEPELTGKPRRPAPASAQGRT